MTSPSNQASTSQLVTTKSSHGSAQEQEVPISQPLSASETQLTHTTKTNTPNDIRSNTASSND